MQAQKADTSTDRVLGWSGEGGAVVLPALLPPPPPTIIPLQKQQLLEEGDDYDDYSLTYHDNDIFPFNADAEDGNVYPLASTPQRKEKDLTTSRSHVNEGAAEKRSLPLNHWKRQTQTSSLARPSS